MADDYPEFRSPVALTSVSTGAGVKHFMLCDDGALYRLRRDQRRELGPVPASLHEHHRGEPNPR